jgi:predicted kinase
MSSPLQAGHVPPAAPLVVAIGPPGAGKSTWLAGRFPVDQLFGFDMFRRMLTSGDVLDQGSTSAAAVMLRELIDFRMATRRTTVVDATNVDWDRREGLRYAASMNGRPAVAVMFHTPLEVCLERNRGRRSAPWAGANDQPVPDEVVENMHARMVADPPRPADFDLVVHVHPDDAAVAYAYPGAGRSVDWCAQLLAAGRWGQGITLLTARGASLPWPTPVNVRG